MAVEIARLLVVDEDLQGVLVPIDASQEEEIVAGLETPGLALFRVVVRTLRILRLLSSLFEYVPE